MKLCDVLFKSLIAVAVGIFISGSPVAKSEELKANTLEVNSPWPLSDAFTRIEEDLHVPINYEQIPIDTPNLLVRGEEIGLAPGLLFPRKETLLVNFVNHESDAYSAVATVLAAYRTISLPGGYEIARNNDQIDVLPKIAIAASGATTDILPLFSRPITLPRQQRTFPEAVQAVVEQMARISGVRIQVLTQPLRVSSKTWTSAEQEPALDVLKHLDEGTRKSFRLLYDPSEKTYYLNVAAVEPLDEKPEPAKRPITSPNPFFVKNK